MASSLRDKQERYYVCVVLECDTMGTVEPLNVVPNELQ